MTTRITMPARPTRLLILAGGLAAGLALGLTYLKASDKDAAAPAKGKPTTVPFELMASNHIAIHAKINGKGPFRLVFDLGAPITLLANKAAETAGVIKPNAPRSFLFAMRGEATVDNLEVGDLKTKDVPVLVFDHPLLKALGGFLGRPLDGIIGFTFFARFKTTIDYQAKTLTFEPVDYAIRDLMKELPNRLAGPKEGREVIVAPLGLWGLTLAKAGGGAGEGAGVSIAAVAADSPAAQAGLKPGDRLTTLDGRWTTTVADAYTAAAAVAPGQTVDAVIERDGHALTRAVTPRAGF